MLPFQLKIESALQKFACEKFPPVFKCDILTIFFTENACKMSSILR